MPAGLEIFNTSGTSIFQTTSALVKFLGVLQIGVDYTGETSSGTASAAPDFIKPARIFVVDVTVSVGTTFF